MKAENATSYHSLDGLQCKECGFSFIGWEDIGFCAYCGAVLCPTCSMTRVEVEDSSTTIIPLLIVTYSKTTEVKFGVTSCKPCKEKIEKELGSRTRNSVLAGFGGFLILFAILFAMFRGSDLFFPLCFSCGFGAILFLFLSTVWMYMTKKKMGPFCPTCGRGLMRYLLAQAKRAGGGLRQVSNHLVCPYCGYTGPISPLEGLWIYVDKNGPSSLSNTVVSEHANFSHRIRHGKK